MSTRRELCFEVATATLGVGQHAAELGGVRILVRAGSSSRSTQALELAARAHEREGDGAGDAEGAQRGPDDEHRTEAFGACREGHGLELALVAIAVGSGLELVLEMGFEADALELGLTDGFEAGLLFALAAGFEHGLLAGFGGEAGALGLAEALGVGFGFESGFSLLFGLLSLLLDLVALVGEQRLEREHEGRFAELGQWSTPGRRRTSACGRRPGWSEEPARAAAVIA